MRKIHLLIFLLIGIFKIGYGQDRFIDSLRIEYNNLYGSDILLNNGRKYHPTTTQAKGSPFLNQEDILGAITVNGRTFSGQKLKYEINKQQFLLSYTDRNNQNYLLILNTPFIDSVRTTDALFIRNKYAEIRQPFVQQIYNGQLKCFASIHKDLDFTSMGVNTGYSYSKELKGYYLVMNGIVHQFSNKASFLKIFPAVKRTPIRTRISKLQIKFRNIDDLKMRQLVEFCDLTMTEKGSTL